MEERYGKLIFKEGFSLNTSRTIGEFIEEKFAEKGIVTALPTAADWGYVFRVHVNIQAFDLFVIRIGNDLWGISTEQTSTLLNKVFRNNGDPLLAFIQNELTAVLTATGQLEKLTWYSKQERLNEFGEEFFRTGVD